ncbi:hypothetical protein BI364_10320 [Acidihalobacter yilgarnensis]|uniref:Histidine phosphatase family protein n=1 Tax=Acidihalobacter yilgarnensis TaxID=2819280 RepID=A0A1D8IPC4_9GAMM|nr:histidine phosphatase family protein [Acidihalobacter yilgarnensis]AOU98301.1 hypothetical protein BI364_10320 [Acidihalobacter yilgarnensis]
MEELDLIVVRHGATPWSVSGQHTSHTDLGLTAAGRIEAERLQPWLAQWSPAAVWTSPLRRARETAAICGYAEAEVVPELQEWDYGDYEGLTTPEIHLDSPGWTVFVGGGAGAGGESPMAVAKRVDQLITRIRDQDCKPVLAFAHGHVLRSLAARWLGHDIRLGARLGLDSGAIGLLGRLHGEAALLAWNLRSPKIINLANDPAPTGVINRS